MRVKTSVISPAPLQGSLSINVSLPQNLEWQLCGDHFGIASAWFGRLLPVTTLFPVSTRSCLSPMAAIGISPSSVQTLGSA
jgi:hypothetical protein